MTSQTVNTLIETRKLAKDFGDKIEKMKPGKSATVIGFVGELGAGKPLSLNL